MKARRTLKNQHLIQEVISQTSQRFAPRIPDIKKVGTLPLMKSSRLDMVFSSQAIETLLEKEYIERVQDTRDTFSYVA
jgi:cullin 1